MNLTQIVNYIQNPNSITGNETDMFKQLSQKYPYVQIFNILYLKSLHASGSILFEEELNKTAYKIYDRYKLFEIINSKVEESEESKNIEVISEEIVNDKMISSPEIIEENIESELEITELLDDSNISRETDEVQIDFDSVIEEKEDEIISLDLQEITENVSEETLENDILTNVIENSFSNIIEPVEIEDEKIKDEISIEENIEEEQESTQEMQVEKIEIQPVNPSKRSFSSWLKSENNVSVEKISVPEIKSGESISSTFTLNEVDEAEIKPNNVEKINKLIDKFINEEPKISKPKKEFFSPEKKAKESVSLETIKYSETLANIIAKQGYFSEAIKAYEQLMLANPEKKIYFAQKIEDLKLKLK